VIATAAVLTCCVLGAGFLHLAKGREGNGTGLLVATSLEPESGVIPTNPSSWSQEPASEFDNILKLLFNPVLSASQNEGAVSATIDSDPETCWSTKTSMKPGMWFAVDLRMQSEIFAVTLDTTGSKNAYPRGYEVYIADNAENMGEPVSIGNGDDPITRIAFETPVPGRFIKIVQTGEADFNWSIHTLTVEHDPVLGNKLPLKVPTATNRGSGRFGSVPLKPGPGAIPMSTSPSSLELGNLSTPVSQAIIANWAARELPSWKRESKVTAPRIALAKLAQGRDIEEVNHYLQETERQRGPGSTWQLGLMGHLGDHDFTEVTLTTVLYLFGDDPKILYPETVEHLLDVQLIEDFGEPDPMVPFTAGTVLDTENHHLMREGSRYLKNQWLRAHGDTDPRRDNARNGLEAWLIAYLEEMRDEGVYEFNSMPYAGYTIQALLNLDAFPESREVRNLARYILDTIAWQFALGSLDLRCHPPFRRQMTHAGDTSLEDYRSQVMRVWTAGPGSPVDSQKGHHALIAALLPYRLPDDVRKWALHKETDYFARIGRGPMASPEIYSGGPGYLLSAGGVHRGPRSMIAARPITLLLSDGARDLAECFHLPGQGRWQEWNSTGVHRHFACSNAPVRIPSQYKPIVRQKNWAVFAPDSVKGLAVATFSLEDLGLLALFPNASDSPTVLAEAIMAANPDEDALRTSFTWPGGGTIEYDVRAPKDLWPITAVNGDAVDRKYDSWPRLDGGPNGVTFERASGQNMTSAK